MDKLVDKRSLTDQNYLETLDKNFKDVPNGAQTPTIKTKVDVNTDFIEASRNFWLSHEGGQYFPVYNEGIMAGTYNTRLPTFTTITETFIEALKNIIRIQCEKDDKTSQEFVTYIEMLEKSFELLADKLESELDARLEGELMMGYLHAVFNSFINTNIKIKE
jgi:hypothetical protein